MKKAALITLLSVSIFNLSSGQTLTNKKGQNVLPEAGNFAVGVDVVPIVKYAGNLFYNGNDSISDLSPIGAFTFFGKYVKNEKTAYRAILRLGFITAKQDTLVPKSSSTNPNELVSDEAKRTQSNIVIGGGIEKRKGSGRVTGIYGVEGRFVFATDKTKYTYGNPLDVTIQSNKQVVSDKKGSAFGFGVRGFLGVEYFIGAKLSLSAEYGWGPAVIAVGRGAVETEVVDGNATKTQITETSKTFLFGFDNDMNGGTVALIFYF
ncbi:MAG: hypothetical protein ABI772_04045 [Bacteroidota bacterium]